MSKIPAINEIDANSPSQESTEVVVKATTVTPDINEIQETISASATIQEIDGTRKPTISEIYKIVNDGLFESTTNWWDYAYKVSQAQLNQDIISRLDNGVIGGGYSKGVEIITTTSNKVPNNTNVYSALKSDSLYPKKLNDEVINGIYDFLNGLTIGKPTAYTGGTWSIDQTGRTHLTTDYLYVRLKAIFETLQILNVDTIGGKLVISPTGSIRVAYVDRIKIDAPVFTHNEETDVWSISQVEDAEGNLVNETLNQEVYRCYFLGEQDGEEIDNKWKVGDQAQAKTFNVKKGTYHKVENSYLWRLVVNVSSDTVDIDGKKYHYVDLSQIDFDSGSDAPAPGDVLNQLGHRLNDTQRQTALVLNAVDNYAPSITLYAGVNYYTLLNKEYVEFGVYNGKAFFNVYGDMYIGDKGENPKTYIKYKNGKINIKANLEIGSSIGDKDLDQYIKDNGGVDEETVINLINNSQVIKDLQKQTDGAIETWFYEGVPTLDNLPAVDWTTEDLKKIHIGDLYYDQTTGYVYRFTKYNDDVNPYRWNRIKDNDIVAALEAANHAQATADGKMKVFYGETKPTNYQVGDMWVNATLEGKFNNDIARAVVKSESFNADDWVLASRYSEAIATIQKWTNEYETKFSNLVDEVKQQKDQSIIVWYLEYEPTLKNLPASGWTKDEMSEHIGDIVYDIKNNHSYRWTGSAWVQIKDADFNEAMKAANEADKKAGAAGDLADSKRRIFYSDTTPTEPFDKGDLWIKQVEGKTETWVYNGTDWVKSEDKDLADFTVAINEELAGIKGQLDGKAETWYQNTDPRNEKTGVWESGGTDKSHEGDIWYNTTNGTTNYWNGSAWEQMDIPKDVFDTIDGKSSIFVDSYADAKAGTGVINKGYKERDLWILPEDAIVNGVKYYKGDMLTAVSNNTNFDETNWKKKVRYVGQAELTSAIDIVNDKINTINNTTIPGINNKFNEFVKDGVLDSSEKARLTDLLNQANNEVAAVVDQVNNIITSKYLTNDNANKGKLEEANTVMNTAWTEYKNFINTLIDANTEITKVNIGEANTKYRNLQEKIKAVKQYLAICQADVLSGMGTDISSYKYLKEAFKGKTEVNGGLVVTNVLQLRQTSDASSPVTAGISGLQGKANADGVVDKNTYDITSIAAWFGGPMVDKDIFTNEQLNNKVAGTDYARSLFRHDGSGYLASGAIYWGTDGVLHGDPNSFILQGTSIATMFYYTRLFYLHYGNQDSTDFNNIDYVTPMKTFSRLSVLPLGGVEDGNNLPTGLFIGDSKTGGSFQIGNIILRTKSGDPNILEIVSASSNKTAHLGVQGGVSAYGTYTPSTGGGGGLNATVVSYANIIAGNYVDTDLTHIPNAYSVKALSNRIDNIATELDGLNLSWNNITDKPTTFTPSAHNHKWIDITDRITKVSQLTNDAGYLTTHQSLADYYTRAEIDAKGYTTNKGTVTSVGLTLPTGLTCAINTITTSGTFAVTFASGYSIPTTTKQSSWDSAVSVKHSHSNKTVLDEITSTKVTNWDSAYSWYSLITTDEETADGIINKWNEVVNFLANIAQTDTLSGIIDGINTSISNEVSRAKKAEGTNASNISANKTSITTLQDYFTGGSAKKALQLTTARNLWGNAFNGTADVNGSIVLPSDKYISIGNIKLEYDATNKALKITNTTTNEVANLYASGGVSAYGVGSVAGSGGGGLNGTIVPYSTAIASDPQNEGSKIASASSIYKLHSRISNIENNGATSITVTGTGNAITSVSKNGTSITFTKGATFLTSHQSLANYVTINDSRLSDSRYPKFANCTWYLVGDNAYIGDHNLGGMFCIKSANFDNVSGVAIYNKAESDVANIWFDNTNINLDKQLVMNNKRIWIQGVGTDGGNNNRLTLVAGMPSGLAYNTSCRGTILYSNGIAFADPYNGNSNNDSGWIRHLETSANSGLLEIGVGDDAANEEIHFRWYNTNASAETIGYDVIVPRDNGILALTKQLPSVGNGTIIINQAGVEKGRFTVNQSGSTTINLTDNNSTYNFYGAYFESGKNGYGGEHDANNITYNSHTFYLKNGPSVSLGATIDSGAIYSQAWQSDWVAQIAQDYRNGRLFVRGKNNNVWQDWKRIAQYEEIPTSLPANGGNADTVDGVHANGLLTDLSNSNNGISITVGGTTKSVSNISVNYASSSGSASKVYGQVGDTGTHELVRCDMNNDQFRIIAGSNGNNNGWAEIATADDGTEPIYVRQYTGVFSSVVRTLTLLDANGYTHFPSYINIGGNENNNSSPDRVWGSNGSDSYLRSYRTSALNVNYAASAGNADTVDGEHASAFTRIVGRYSIDTSGTAPYNYIHLFRIANSLGYSTIDCEIDFRTRYHSAKIEIRISTAQYPYNSGGSSISIVKKVVSGRTCNLWFLPTVQTYNYNYYDVYYESGAWNSGSYGIISKGNNGNLVFEHKGTNLASLPDKVIPVADNVAASVTKLQTARTIWGQSFDGTGNVDGTIYINNSDSSNGAIRLNNNVNSNARISAISDQVIFNTGNAIRFGETSWDWNQWAGLKYTHSNKTIYLGIAENSVFNANSAQSDGTLRLAGIKTVTPDSGARIGGSNGDLYLGNANNSGWVKVQDMCSQATTDNWIIYQNGSAKFKDLTINSVSTFNGSVEVNNMLTAKAIMFTTAYTNAYGTDLQNWDGSIAANVTNMFNGIPYDNISIEYSRDNGASWTTYTSDPSYRFNLVNDNTPKTDFMLGNASTDNKNQLKQNQLRVTIKIPNEICQELSWISVEVNKGVFIKCQVYLGDSNGNYSESTYKIIKGSSHLCDICVGPLGIKVGNNTHRYVRLVFSHTSITLLRNGIVSKIRGLALTKYNKPGDRYNISTTGHIYDYDYNMNTYFPNSILAEGGVTAYQSSDVRLKTNITKLNCLNVIKSIGGTYEFDYIRDHKHSIGFVAQNVNNPLLKDIVAKDDNGYLKINYWNPKLISLAFGALTEIDDEVDKLKARVRELENEVEYLKNKDYVLR